LSPIRFRLSITTLMTVTLAHKSSTLSQFGLFKHLMSFGWENHGTFTIKRFTAIFLPYCSKLECLPLFVTSVLVKYFRTMLGANH
jgi:hypothetical protein